MPSSTTQPPGRVLVVDDISANVRLLEGILKVAGFDTVSASSGAEALAFLEADSPDVVLLDVMMPEMDGFEVCRRLRANPATEWLPVVMVTALHETSDRVAALDAGADDFLTKPVDETEVTARVHSLIRIKRQREQLENAYANLQRAESLRDSLAAMLVHDLRTPLTAILGGLDMMMSSPLEGFQQELAEISLRSGQRLLSLVNDLLDVSKMESGQMTLERQPAQPTALINDACEQIAPHRGGQRTLTIGNEVTLCIGLPPNLPVIYVDQDLICRTLVNLVGNAARFEPPRGTVEVKAAVEPASTGGSEDGNDGNTGSLLKFSIADHGQGIAPADQELIFEKFGQVQSAQKNGRKFSTGLGLAFCKLAVEAHGGHIWVESSPGQGSTFYFTIPLDKP